MPEGGERDMRIPGLRSRLLAMTLAMLVAAPAVAVAAGQGVGMIKTSAGDVRIERDGQSLPAPVGTRVEATDVVRTGKGGSVGISFLDQSRLSLGPNSVLAIDRFEFDPTTHAGAFDSTLRRGTLSAVSGKLAHQSPKAMRVRTRSTVLAVRGTEFVVSVR
jgi:hypothetical protein